MEIEGSTFRKENFQHFAFTAFGDMKKNRQLIDFEVTIQKKMISAHRIVLAAMIPYFRSLFSKSLTEISLDGIDADILEDIIDYAYKGELKITKAKVRSLLTASHLLQMTELNEVCVKFMSTQITISNIFEVRAFAGNIQSSKLNVACDRFILRNFEELTSAKSMEFSKLPFPYLKEMLSRDDLNAGKEENVFEAVIKWVESSPVERRDLLPELLCTVRMTHLPTQYLVERVSTEKLIRTSPLSKQLVEDTKNYHLLPKESRSLNSIETRSRNANGHGKQLVEEARNYDLLPKESRSLNSIETCSRNAAGHCLFVICCSNPDCFLELYDVVRGVWIALTTLRDKEWNRSFDEGWCAAVGYNEKIYFFRKATEIETFDVRTFQMQQLTTTQNHLVPIDRVEQVVLHQNKFFLFWDKLMYSFDPQENKFLGLQTVLNWCESGIASLREYIYITGGYTIEENYTNISKRYNCISAKQHNISPMLKRSSGHGCVALNDMIYVCGGFACHDHAEVYDPRIDKWTYIPPLKFQVLAGCFTTLVSYKGKLHAFVNDEVQMYDPESREWTKDIALPHKCRHREYLTVALPGDEKRK